METYWLGIIVHWLHVILGIFWAGGQIFMGFVIWPTLIRRPAAEGRAFWDAALPIAGPLMGASGGLVMLLGLVRGTVFGPVRSFEYLLGSSYGHTFLTALILTIGVSIYGGRVRAQVPQRLWAGDKLSPEGARWLRGTNIVTVVVLALIVVCMVLMRFGL